MFVASPCALAIGGLDPGGGAGIAADLRAFEAAGVFGCAALSLVTVQSTAGLRTARAVSSRELTAQVTEVLAHQRVRAVKIGALGSRENVRAVARLLRARKPMTLVVDTPIMPTSGRGRLLDKAALDALREELLPLATLVTVNVAEARALTGRPVASVKDAREAAFLLTEGGARAALVKGGHLEGHAAIDVLWLDGRAIELRAQRIPLPAVHGAGCTFASLIAGRLAFAESPRITADYLLRAVRWAKRRHHAALTRALDVGDGLLVLRFA